MKFIGLIATLAVFFGIGAWLWSYGDNEATKIPQAYQIMDKLENEGVFGQGLEFKKLEGDGVVKVDEFKDKVVIFSFWATWCAPCVDEFPSLITLLDKFPDKVVLLAISHDDKAKDVKDFVNAFEGWRPNMHVVFDEKSKVSQSMGVGLLPEGYIFDKKGKLVKKIVGIQDWASPSALKYFEGM